MSENQGCWYAGIKAEDLTQPNPVVYYNDQDEEEQKEASLYA